MKVLFLLKAWLSFTLYIGTFAIMRVFNIEHNVWYSLVYFWLGIIHYRLVFINPKGEDNE